MSNMGHCRFENTLHDLRECCEVLTGLDSFDFLSESEASAAKQLIDLCKEIYKRQGKHHDFDE